MERVKLGEICEIVSGSTPKTGVTKYWDGDINWITPAELTDETYIIEESQRKITDVAVQETGLRSFPKGTVILSSRAPIGKVAIAGKEMYCNQGFKNLICSEKIDNRYLYWYLKGHTDYLNSLGRGATFKEISKSIVENIEIPLPGLAEQSNCADVLEKCRNLILTQKTQIKQLDLLIKSRFVEMFGDESRLDLWTCCTVEDVADVCVGVVIKPTQYYTEKEKGIRAFRSLNIGCMNVKDSDWVYFTEEGHAKNRKSVIRENDVLVVRSGAPGTACVATSKYAGSNAVDIIIAHPNEKKVNPVFLAMFTNMPHGMNQIRERIGGAAQQHFNVGGYKALKLIMPPLKLQEEFATFISQVDKLKAVAQKRLEKIQLLFDSLMQQYFG